MAAADPPWAGTWIDVSGPLSTTDELVLTVASRRNTAPEAVSEAFEQIDDRFDVDSVYLDPN